MVQDARVGTIAQNHYLLSKALCYHEIAKGIEVEEPEKKYALLREVRLIQLSCI